MEFMKQHRRAIYIALALCVVAAGVTGYLLTNRETPNQQASANQPVVDVNPPVVTPVTPDLPVQEEPQEDEEPPVEAVAELLPQVVSPLDGTTVCITHSGGYVTRYSSLQENPPISQGQQVKAGDIVGYVGTAAAEASMGPHLHFAVEKDGSLIDPKEYIK